MFAIGVGSAAHPVTTDARVTRSVDGAFVIECAYLVLTPSYCPRELESSSSRLTVLSDPVHQREPSRMTKRASETRKRRAVVDLQCVESWFAAKVLGCLSISNDLQRSGET